MSQEDVSKNPYILDMKTKEKDRLSTLHQHLSLFVRLSADIDNFIRSSVTQIKGCTVNEPIDISIIIKALSVNRLCFRSAALQGRKIKRDLAWSKTYTLSPGVSCRGSVPILLFSVEKNLRPAHVDCIASKRSAQVCHSGSCIFLSVPATR